MASIFSRRRKDGTTAHLAQITMKRDGRILHRETKTFDRKQAAKAWGNASISHSGRVETWRGGCR